MIDAVSSLLEAGAPAAAVVLLAAFIKGAIGFGFPTLGTPLLALFVDAKTAVVTLILPNIVMDGVQALRRGGLGPTVRRMAALMAAGTVGTVLGTRLLVLLSPRAVTLILGAFVLLFAALNLTRSLPRVPEAWERWLSPLVGLGAGVIGGITNVPGTPLVLYFYALGMAKEEFVRSVAVTFVYYKLIQLGAVAWFGLLSWPLLGASAGLSLIGLGSFVLGLRVQDRLAQQAFNRAVLAFLVGLGLWLVWRSLP